MPIDTSGKYLTPTKTRYVVEGTQMLNFKGEMIGRTFITLHTYQRHNDKLATHANDWRYGFLQICFNYFKVKLTSKP
jgi:hypothetical protein